MGGSIEQGCGGAASYSRYSCRWTPLARPEGLPFAINSTTCKSGSIYILAWSIRFLLHTKQNLHRSPRKRNPPLAKMRVRESLVSGVVIALCAFGVQGDGTGLIGWGKTLYNPTCSFACRNVIRKQQLSCTPVDSSENHGTAHNPVSTPATCFVKDPAFLKTMALCIDTYCPLAGNPPLGLIEDYWISHLGTGTLGNYKYVPTMSYHDALAAARKEELEASHGMNSTAGNSTSHGHRLKARQHDHGTQEEAKKISTFDVSSPLPTAAGGSAVLNVTSFIDPEDWQLQYNYMYDFETNEAGHSTMT
jgi:hypothetical protein